MDNMEDKVFLTRGKAILFGLLLVIILIVFIVIKTINSNKVDDYKDFEEELKYAAMNYVDINNIRIDEGEEKRLSLAQILKNYSTDNKLKNKCTGYVIVVNEKDITNDEYSKVYRPYIKCSNKYITTNYSEY